MMEMMQENDCWKVPEVYMKMSDVELEKEKQKLLAKIKSQPKRKPLFEKGSLKAGLFKFDGTDGQKCPSVSICFAQKCNANFTGLTNSLDMRFNQM